MEIANVTRLVAGCTTSIDKEGRESLVVVAKGTYLIPGLDGDEAHWSETQAPLTPTDVFHGEPGASAIQYENDFAPFKPRCDVLLNGRCHAPGGQPATEVTVGFKVGALVAAFKVVGPRRYTHGVLSASISTPEPFTTAAITYETAYGGVDRAHPDAHRHRCHPLNHVGVGFHPEASLEALRGLPLPLTEELQHPVRKPDGHYRPMAFGALARAWQPRLRWGGTYDEAWMADQFPFPPLDFDMRYFQSAPEDQQMDYPRGGEEVALLNLSPRSRLNFRLPARLDLPVLFVDRRGEATEVQAVVDTVLIEPDEGRLMLVWRAAMPLKRNIRELAQVVTGQTRKGWLKARESEERRYGKPHFTSLAEAVRWAAQRRGGPPPQGRRP